MRKGMTASLILLLVFMPASGVAAASQNIVRIGGDITVSAGQRVRNALAVGGQITIHGTVEGHAMAIGGSVVLSGTALVGGSVVSVGGIIVIGKGARVRGDIREINASDISSSLSSVLNGDWKGWSWVFAVLSLLVFLGVVLVAMMLVTVIPKQVCRVSEVIKDTPIRAFLWGLLVLISVVPLAALLTISILGIALIPLEITIVMGSALIGFIGVAQLVGEQFFALVRRVRQGPYSTVFFGLLILWLIGWLPHIGWLIKVIAVVLGLGGVFVTCLDAGSQWKKSRMAVEASDEERRGP